MVFSEEYQSDIAKIVSLNCIDFNLLRNKTILITGATGLIGTSLINTLHAANQQLSLNCHIYAIIRNPEKAKRLLPQSDDISLIINDITNPLETVEHIDYIIHAASDTSSKHFVDNPLDIIDTTLNGTKNILDLAKKSKAEKLIFLSTMEVYGRPTTEEKIDESHSTNLQTNEARNCYPISKRMAENICFCFAQTHNLNVNILRLTQTFGPGVNYDDDRVFADFARSIIENRNIILHTTGETKRQYLYVLDAVSAILTVLTSDSKNQIYNVANESTFCSIREMADTAASLNQQISVIIEAEDNISQYGYAPTLIMNLDTTKIQSLGWKPSKNLEQMFESLIRYLKDNQ